MASNEVGTVQWEIQRPDLRLRDLHQLETRQGLITNGATFLQALGARSENEAVVGSSAAWLQTMAKQAVPALRPQQTNNAGRGRPRQPRNRQNSISNSSLLNTSIAQVDPDSVTFNKTGFTNNHDLSSSFSSDPFAEEQEREPEHDIGSDLDAAWSQDLEDIVNGIEASLSQQLPTSNPQIDSKTPVQISTPQENNLKSSGRELRPRTRNEETIKPVSSKLNELPIMIKSPTMIEKKRLAAKRKKEQLANERKRLMMVK